MPSKISNSPIAIIGGGFGALMAYIQLRFRGVPPSAVVVYSPETDPTASWTWYAEKIAQQQMRSESEGHFFPTDSPGLATVQALEQLSLWPVIEQWFDQYHPTVDYFLSHARAVAEQAEYQSALALSTISRLTRLGTGFALFNEFGQQCGQAERVIVAVGHGLPYLPKFFQAYRQQHPDDTRVSHSFEEKIYCPNQAYLVVGDGLTAATEWTNILQQEGVVLAVTRDRWTKLQALNTPRRFFSKRGLKPYSKLTTKQRRQQLATATQGSIAKNYRYQRLLMAAEREGRLQFLTGEIERLQPGAGDHGLEATLQTLTGEVMTLSTDVVIAATGFQPASTHPLLQQMTADLLLEIDDSGHPIVDDSMKAADNLYFVGAAAAWALPTADSLGGMKIAARRIASDILGAEQPWQQLARWWQFVINRQKL